MSIINNKPIKMIKNILLQFKHTIAKLEQYISYCKIGVDNILNGYWSKK